MERVELRAHSTRQAFEPHHFAHGFTKNRYKGPKGELDMLIRGLMTVPRACKVIACAIAVTQMVECAPVNYPSQPSSNIPSKVDAGDSYYGPPFQPSRVAPALDYSTRPLKDIQSHRHDTPQTPFRLAFPVVTPIKDPLSNTQISN
ncbi:uncharacterized protein LACBIDRAFT_308102 [Laccaria bicolor S238N-H82]|uniref:Predicted protein n=1 Tax=Laccaria bicolor (strain S238N-H82 / ATCC MYA-4686) TaxID=486041 RepID=B0DRN1_LACBS|nr:uncharacterized protein LACBIDRAFT_308102 [Laccaria bicolor S238N-H82]EDR02813.1 predicted protein [Laccaria bicolor S238N-H82]|eukprot:XP_001886523.1 predicted protein [Laccaria bicolor S238N-H82]